MESQKPDSETPTTPKESRAATQLNPLDALKPTTVPPAMARFLPVKGIQINATAQMESIRLWYEQHAPDLMPIGLAEHDPTVREAVTQLVDVEPRFPAALVFQAGLAATLQSAYKLSPDSLAILAGGIPIHPLTPAPEKVKVYSDAMQDVVSRARQIGYKARLLEIGHAPDIQHLADDGIEDVIMTGIAYTQDDGALAEMLRRMRAAGIKRVFLNYATPQYAPGSIEPLRARGWKITLREPNDAWKIALLARVPNMTIIDGWRLLPFFPEPDVTMKLSNEEVYRYHLIVAYCFEAEIPAISDAKSAAENGGN